ncbi:MAG TPA: hypothetical protein VG321_05735 [Solirubrobacteraceae bacterium]|nr:hypothetical protein [Solirubrobacteraceae bacterium]
MTDIAAPPLVAQPAAAEQAHPAGPPVIPEFEIVPRVGLAIAGVVLVLLVVAVAADKLWPLMFLHVVGGAGWTIVDLFVGLLIGPILGRLPLQSRIDFTTRFMPKMVVLMPILVAVTLTAGWQLASHTGTNLTGDPNHGWIVASFIVVGVMAVLALGLLEPANIAVLIELKKPRPNGQVIEKLMKRFVYCAGILGIMQVATFVIMTHLASS